MSHTVTRDQLAYFVGTAFSITWAGRAQLLRTAFDNNAPHEVITELVALPERYFKSLDDIFEILPHLTPGA